MKIMYLSATAGGVLKYIKDLAYGISKKDESIEQIGVFSSNHKEMVEKDLDFMEEKIYLNMKSGRNIFQNIPLIKKLRKIIEKQKPDIVYIHGARISYVSRMALKPFKDIKVIFNSHGWNVKNIFNKFFERYFAKRTDITISNSKKELDIALNNKINPKIENIKINNGINFDTYKKLHNDEKYKSEIRQKIREDLKIEKFQKAVVQVGNINEKRDPFIFLNACLAIIKMGYNIKIILIGDGEEEKIKKIMEFAESNNILDKIEITGWIDKLSEYLISMDIAVSTIKDDDSPIALAEYMAAKLPIIANNSSVNGEILDYGKFGKIVNSGDIEDYVLKIQEVFVESEKNTRIKESSYRYAFENYNLENLIDKHIAVFKIVYEEK